MFLLSSWPRKISEISPARSFKIIFFHSHYAPPTIPGRKPSFANEMHHRDANGLNNSQLLANQRGSDYKRCRRIIIDHE